MYPEVDEEDITEYYYQDTAADCSCHHELDISYTHCSQSQQDVIIILITRFLLAPQLLSWFQLDTSWLPGQLS